MIGERIRLARKKAGLTQQELSEKLSVTSETISRYESDLMAPKDDKKVALACMLNVSLDYLLGATDLELPLEPRNAIYLPKDFPPEAVQETKDFIKILVTKYTYKNE